MWIVVSNNTEKVFGIFDNENSALNWARTQVWERGYAVRPIQGV